MKTKNLLFATGILAALAFVSCEKDPVSGRSGILSQKLMGGENEESINTILATPDGGHLLVGTTNSNNSGDVRASHGSGTTDWWVVRFNSNNDTVWTRTLGGSGNEAMAVAAATPDGGFVITGYTDSHNNGDVGANHSINYPDCWVVKLTANGDIAWTRVLGGTNEEFGHAITVTTDGSIVIAARTNSSNGDVTGAHGPSNDYWIVKLSSNGQLVWQKALGGTANENASAITATADGGVVVAGTSSSNNGDVGTIIGSYDAWIVKLDVDGNFVWKKVVGGSDMEYVNGICKTNDGGYVVAGTTRSHNSGNVGSNHGQDDGWVFKLNGNGEVVWTNTLGGDDYESFYGIVATPDGGYMLCGYTESDNNGDVEKNHGDSDGWLVKLNATGQKSWTRNLGGTDFDDIYGIALNSDGSYILGGSAYSSKNGDVSGTNHGNGTADAWIVKFR